MQWRLRIILFVKTLAACAKSRERDKIFLVKMISLSELNRKWIFVKYQYHVHTDEDSVIGDSVVLESNRPL